MECKYGNIETIAAANAAYAVIKKFAENGRETANLAKSVGQFLQAEDDLREQVSKKKSSTWAKALGKDANDFEEFWHLSSWQKSVKSLEEYLTALCKARHTGKVATISSRGSA